MTSKKSEDRNSRNTSIKLMARDRMTLDQDVFLTFDSI